jgi:dolichol-phosphate mannosyltransferase
MVNKKVHLKKTLVSICIPVFNEEECIEPLLLQLSNICRKLSKEYDFEIIFTDNASTDNTWMLLKNAKLDYALLRAFKFSKNIGFQKSILFNYQQSNGSVVIQLDADLQDPPELIEVFLQHWQEGFKVVSGVRVERSESKWISWIRRFGYWFIDLASEYPIKRNTGDFRLLDRQVVEALTKIKSPKPYLRGTISRMGVREKDVLYSRSARKFGQSKFGLWALIKLGLTALANHSNISIKLGNIVGFLALMLSIAGSLYVMYLRVFQPELPRGFASIYIMILFGIGVNAILLSILGSFVKKIYEILSEEDLTIVVDKIQ